MMTLYKRNPAFAFILLSFLFSWLIWISSPVLSFGREDVQRLLDMTGAFGPSLAAILITFKLEGRSLMPDIRLHLSIFLVTGSMIIFAMPSIFEMTYDIPSVLVGLILADVAAYVIGMAIKHRADIPLCSSAVSYKHHRRWIFIAALLFPAMVLVGSLIDHNLGGTVMTNYHFGGVLTNLLMMVLAIVVFAVFGGSIGEELGWRGFLTSTLLENYNPILLGLFIGFVWSLWHVPLHFNGFYETGSFETGVTDALVRFVWNVPLAVLFTWVYIRSKASVLLAIIMHTSVNASQYVLPLSGGGIEIGMMIMIGFTVLVVFVDPLMRDGKKARHFLYKL